MSSGVSQPQGSTLSCRANTSLEPGEHKEQCSDSHKDLKVFLPLSQKSLLPILVTKFRSKFKWSQRAFKRLFNCTLIAFHLNPLLKAACDKVKRLPKGSSARALEIQGGLVAVQYS